MHRWFSCGMFFFMRTKHIIGDFAGFSDGNFGVKKVEAPSKNLEKSPIMCFPAYKLKSFIFKRKFINQPWFRLSHIYSNMHCTWFCCPFVFCNCIYSSGGFLLILDQWYAWVYARKAWFLVHIQKSIHYSPYSVTKYDLKIFLQTHHSE